MNKPIFDFGEDESQFPSAEVEDFNFFYPPSNEHNESVVVQARVSEDAATEMSNIIQRAKEQGVNLKRPSDFIRMAFHRALNDMAAFLDMGQDEGTVHYLFRQKQAAKIASETAQTARVTGVVGELFVGLRNLTSDTNREWKEAKNRLVNFLVPILQLAGDQDFLMLLYIKAMFGNKGFVKVLDRMEERVKLGPIVENARRAYERTVREE
jgi:hypothetical protein